MTSRIDGYSAPAAYTKPLSAKAPQIDRTFETFLTEAWKKPEKTAELKFSKHAQKRLEERGIQLDETDLNKLEEAVVKMEGKGARQSLLLYEDLALITSIHNLTIITALKASNMTEITDIDSAIVVTK